MTQNIDLLLFDNFSLHCLANTVEPLRAANTVARRKLYDWRFLTLDGAPATSSSGMEVYPFGALSVGSGDMLVVMPSYGLHELDTKSTARQIKTAKSRYRILAGFDTGSWLLARAGLLDGRRATIHWEEFTRFEETFPEVDAVRQRFVIEEDRITCSGAMAAFDLVMHLIGETHGPLITVEVGQIFMTESSTRAHRFSPTASGRMVDRVLHLMQDNLEQPLTMPQIARQVGVSQKLLEQRMHKELGETPQAIYRRLRLNLARKLVAETDQSVSEIASRCGYENASAMTRAFRAQFGCTPRQLRRGEVGWEH